MTDTELNELAKEMNRKVFLFRIFQFNSKF